MQQTAPQAYLIIQVGHRWTDVLRLQQRPVFIGRSSDSQIVVRDERVSRKHAEILPLSGGWAVRDLGSRNGTQVNEQTIQDEHPLQDGDTIGVGGCRITFSHSLASGFSSSRRMAGSLEGGSREGSAGNQVTEELAAPPAIVKRRSQSQWSAAMRRNTIPSATGDAARSDHWNFFYRLVADLVRSDSPEQAAQTALEHLLDQLGINSGGVVTLETADEVFDSSTQQRDTLSNSKFADLPLPPLAVLATRQPEDESYQRVSDFLVRTLIRDRQAILARNVMDDSNLSLMRRSARRDVVSIICAPLRSKTADGEAMIGLLHVYSAGEERMLTDVDLDLTVGVADNLAIALTRQVAAQQLSQSLASSRRRIDQLQAQLAQATEMVGDSLALRRVRHDIHRAAPTSATVLVRGESGVGKELVARAIHNQSPRRDAPLVCLNCAALAPTLLESELFGHEKGAFTGATERKIGKFEAADGGTLLLDEIGEMPPELQAKFLRVIEGQPFERLGGNKPIKTNVRVIAATNRDLEEAVTAKEFRADLYYRLRVIEIDVPPLRQRLEDVPPLVEFFLEQFRGHAGRRLTGIEPAALELLKRHSWPGNIRELRNVIERAVVLGSEAKLGVDDLKISTLGEVSLATGAQANALSEGAASTYEPISLAELEKRHILATLEYSQGNKTKASQWLGIERSTLDRKLKRYD